MIRYSWICRWAFRGLEYLPRIKVGFSALDRQGSFIAERDGSIIGCIGLLKLDRPGWFEIRNLAVRNTVETDTAKALTRHVVEYVGANDAEYVKAITPAVQPYVDLYKVTKRSVLNRLDDPFGFGGT